MSTVSQALRPGLALFIDIVAGSVTPIMCSKEKLIDSMVLVLSSVS